MEATAAKGNVRRHLLRATGDAINRQSQKTKGAKINTTARDTM